MIAMRFSWLALATLALANASPSDSVRRHLSFDKIAGYDPATQVSKKLMGSHALFCDEQAYVFVPLDLRS